MNTKEKRSKLAMLMGWYKVTDPDSMTQLGVPQPCVGDEVWVKPDHSEWVWPNQIPDPFTDANADYSVLEWIRLQAKVKGVWNRNMSGKWIRAISDVCRFARDYKIGDYARAALKVIGHE